MEKPARPSHLHVLIATAEKRREAIRERMAWVEERRRELWRRIDEREAAPDGPAAVVSLPAGGGAAESDPVPVFPLL